MAQNESVERYLSEQYPEKYQSTDPDDKAYISRLRNRINESIGYFESKGITSPREDNYLELNAWVSLKEGKPKGKPISKKTVADWVSCTRSYYNWKKGEKQMSLIFEETEATGANEPEGTEPQLREKLPEAESVAVQEVIGADDEADVQEVTTEEKDTQAFSPVDTPEAEYITDTEQKPKRGRKPKNADERKTVKLSIYLTPSLFADLRDLAHYSQQDISDVLFGLVEDFATRNSEALLDYRSFLARRKILK